MKVDRCKKVELILDDAFKLASDNDVGAITITITKKIKKRIFKLNDNELVSLMKTIVEMEHTSEDVYRANKTNGDIISVLKPYVLNNARNIKVYNLAKKRYEKQANKLKSHSLINRLIKVNRAYKMIRNLARYYIDAQKIANEDRNYNEYIKIKYAQKIFYNEAVDLARLLSYFDHRELASLRAKCKNYDYKSKSSEAKGEYRTSLSRVLNGIADHQTELEQRKNEINSNISF